MNTPYFTDADQQPKELFLSGSCGSDRVYVSGLEAGTLVVSHAPYYIQNANGLMVGLDERFTRFEVIRQGEVLTVLSLNWKTDCSGLVTETLSPTPLANGIGDLPIPVILMIVSVMYLAILRRIRR